MEQNLRDSHLRILWISRIDYETNSGVGTHKHDDFYQLIFIINGSGTIYLGRDCYNIEPDYCYFIPKGMSHSFHFSSDSTTLDFKFLVDDNELEKIIVTSKIDEPKLVGNLLNKLKGIFKLSSDNLHRPHDILPYRIDVEFKGFLLAFLQQHSKFNEAKPSESLSVIQDAHPDLPIVDFLVENLQSKVTLEDMAKHFNFHPHYLIELFRKNLGTTPMQFLQKLRVEKSKEYLEFTNSTVTEISELVGLTPPYFSRLFRDREGISPSDYREQTRNVVGKDIVLEEDFLLDLQPAVVSKSE
ncbi:AraC family transcriptional regulator [Halalkalibacter kiskunsagensis]|uniref:AraC family transcriptional regulator n=1 Tax=Halalkalibacter kiskunsagensis TaxID=1548599 RepID=A0ABV6KDD1_9BACI